MKLIIDIPEEKYEWVKKNNPNTDTNSIVGAIANGTPYEERTKGKWVPVNDRLPDLFEVVLVTDECGKVFEYERRSLDDDGNVCDEWCFLGRNIVAWMPLPEPYEKGGTECR